MSRVKTVRQKRAGRGIRLILKGAITLGQGSGSLMTAVSRALRNGAEGVEIDVSRVPFIDAAGLGALVACQTMIERAGATFNLDGVHDKARELLAITGLDQKMLRPVRPPAQRRLRLRIA